jgi:hypothetical protein
MSDFEVGWILICLVWVLWWPLYLWMRYGTAAGAALRAPVRSTLGDMEVRMNPYNSRYVLKVHNLGPGPDDAHSVGIVLYGRRLQLPIVAIRLSLDQALELSEHLKSAR